MCPPTYWSVLCFYCQYVFEKVLEAGLRISYHVSIKTRDLDPFHSIEKYRVSNPQYQVSLILKNCDFFAKKTCILRPKIHIFGSLRPQTPSLPYLGSIRQKMPKKVIEKFP